MLIAILLAPATRVGYVLYPINLFVWAWMLNQADDPAVADAGAGRRGAIPGPSPFSCRREARTARRRTG